MKKGKKQNTEKWLVVTFRIGIRFFFLRKEILPKKEKSEMKSLKLKKKIEQDWETETFVACPLLRQNSASLNFFYVKVLWEIRA